MQRENFECAVPFAVGRKNLHQVSMLIFQQVDLGTQNVIVADHRRPKDILVRSQNIRSGNLVAPLLNISSIRVNDKLIDYSEDIVLPPGNYRVQINYLGINLKSPGEVKYQSKLEGYGDWSDISNDTTVTYAHLTTGKYKFILNASSEDGIVTEKPVMLNIRIKKFTKRPLINYALGY